ncbi:MAG: DNA mismatch repair protein MutS [Clostridia bacterium]|nr:DNA mismatch repair protein MutS [Clostridia bacterium]
MFFVADSEKQLELDYILNKIKVQTPFGEKQKKAMRVYKADESSALYAHYETIETLKNAMDKHPVTFKKIREVMSHFKGIDLTLERIYDLEVLSVTELFEVKYFTFMLKQLVELSKAIDVIKTYQLERLTYIEKLLDPDDLEMNTFYLYDSYSEPLKVLREQIKNLESEIITEKKLERQKWSEKLNLKIRPNDEVIIEKHHKDIVETLDAHDAFVYVSDTFMHRTYKVRTSEEALLKAQELSNLKLEEEQEEYKVRQFLTERLSQHLYDIRIQIFCIGKLDLHMAQSYFAKAFHMVKPQLSNTTIFEMHEGIHLIVEEHLKQENLDFIPISMNLSSGVSCITGANMGGKTIGLRLIGQMVMMAQLGLFVPCQSLKFKPLNFVFLSALDGQSIDRGLSTFGAEMVNLASVLKHANEEGLILIDELARGTNPKEGYAISKAIINYLKSKSSITVITTHFDGLADEKDVLHLQVTGLSEVDFEDLEINFEQSNLEKVHQLMDYRLKVITDKESVPKDAIKISKLMGIDEEILEDAKCILERKEEK